MDQQECRTVTYILIRNSLTMQIEIPELAHGRPSPQLPASNLRNRRLPGRRRDVHSDAAYEVQAVLRPADSACRPKSHKDTVSRTQPRKWVDPPPKEKPNMTDMPDDLPSPDEFRVKMAHVDREFADARRYLSALYVEDNHALGALMVEIHRSGRAMNVLAAMAVL